jgi:hypothetical protein
LAQVVVVAVEHRAQRLVAQAQQVDVQQVAVAVVARKPAHGEPLEGAAMDFSLYMKFMRDEQDLRSKEQHGTKHRPY